MLLAALHLRQDRRSVTARRCGTPLRHAGMGGADGWGDAVLPGHSVTISPLMSDVVITLSVVYDIYI